MCLQLRVDLGLICYAAEKFFVTYCNIRRFLRDQQSRRPLNIMSSLARKFGMSHLLPTESSPVIYPTGQHQHHVESDFSFDEAFKPQQNHILSYHNQQENQHRPYQKQKEYQQQKKSLPTSIKMETNSTSDMCTSMSLSTHSRLGMLDTLLTFCFLKNIVYLIHLVCIT